MNVPITPAVVPRSLAAAQMRVSALLAAAIGGTWLVIHFGAIFGPAPGTWPALALVGAVIVQAWLSTGLFIIAHDCMHGAFAPGRPGVNRWVGRAALMSYAGIDYDRMAPAHFDHHKHVGSDRDPDFNAADPRALTPWLLRFFFNYYTHAQLGRITLAACAYLLLGATLWNIVLFWAVPALLAVVQLFVFGTWLPHRHGDSEFADAHRARSVGGGGVGSLLSCFHFGGYHHEHHLSPRTPWWRLPAARAQARSSAGAR